MAVTTAEQWKSGLESHGIDADRMRRLKESAEITINTPGSATGVELNVLGSLQAPELDWTEESEMIRDEISALVSSLLVLAGIESDPVSGQEHILLATIIEHFWEQSQDLDLATLVGQIPKPPFRKMGVFDVDTFIPEKDRMELALKLNGLLASPSFAAWMEGSPLDIEEMIGGSRAKAAIVYMSHLSDEERQFLVTMLLGKTVTWIRSRPGTSELRALIYMDEVFGFAPPTREPPSKTPILTILKQARAHGVGMVLSTQNPVDLDYKAMSNAGTWMVGRLQTENDKKRILEGLTSASGEVDIQLIDKQLSDLGKRQFVLHTTQMPTPKLFGTRWAMSYLAGPLTRDQVANLMEGRKGETALIAAPVDSASPITTDRPEERIPAVAEGTRVAFLDPAASWAGRVGADPTGTVYEPAAAATVQLAYDESRADLNHRETYEAVIFPLDGVVDLEDVIVVDHDEADFLAEPGQGATYRLPALPMDTKTFWAGVGSDLRDHLVANRPLEIWANPSLKLYSRVEESDEQFRARCVSEAERAADGEMAKLRGQYQAKVDRVTDEMAAAQTRYHEADAVAAAKSEETLIGTAGDLLGAFLGGRSNSTALNKVARRRTAAAKAEAKAGSEAARYHAKHAELQALEDELAAELEEIVERCQGMARDVERLEVALEEDDVQVVELRLVWIPVGRDRETRPGSGR